MGGQSSKEQLSSIVARLSSSSIDPTDHEFWDELWKTSLAPEDIFDVIKPADVRKIISVRESAARIFIDYFFRC